MPSSLDLYVLDEIFQEVKIRSNNDEDDEVSDALPLANFMLSGKAEFNLCINYYMKMKMKEAVIGEKSVSFRNVRDEEYIFSRKFPLFNAMCTILMASVEKITCFKSYPKDLPLFKNVKSLKEFTSDAFFLLNFSKDFVQIGHVDKMELITQLKDLMKIHNLPFPCRELYIKDLGFQRFMKTKFTKFTSLTNDFATVGSKNLEAVKKLTIDDYINDTDVGSIKFKEIATRFSSKFGKLESLTIVFIIFMEDKLNVMEHFTLEYLAELGKELHMADFQLNINFELYLSCIKQNHVQFYDNLVQDERFEINQEERTAKQIIDAGKCKMDILFSFG